MPPENENAPPEQKPATTTEKIRALRELTGASIAVCAKAIEVHGSVFEAEPYVRRVMGEAGTKITSSRSVQAGIFASYVHHDGSIASIIELCAETDFACKSDVFKRLARELAMHYAFAGGTEEEFLNHKSMFDQSQTVSMLLVDMSAKIGECVKLGQLVRLSRR